MLAFLWIVNLFLAGLAEYKAVTNFGGEWWVIVPAIAWVIGFLWTAFNPPSLGDQLQAFGRYGTAPWDMEADWMVATLLTPWGVAIVVCIIEWIILKV